MKRKFFVCLSLLSLFLTCFSCRTGNNTRKPEPSPDARPMRFAGTEIGRADAEVRNFLARQFFLSWNGLRKWRPTGLAESGILREQDRSYRGIRQFHGASDLKGRDMEAVKRMLFSASSYEFQWSKRTRLRPSHALRVMGRGEYFDIAIDFNSRQWCFSFRDMQKEEDISKEAAAALHEIMHQAFDDK
ncbi:MAG: hypothetical protein R2941_00950 [Desulfobacterales bacterium]